MVLTGHLIIHHHQFKLLRAKAITEGDSKVEERVFMQRHNLRVSQLGNGLSQSTEDYNHLGIYIRGLRSCKAKTPHKCFPGAETVCQGLYPSRIMRTSPHQDADPHQWRQYNKGLSGVLFPHKLYCYKVGRGWHEIILLKIYLIPR